MNATPPGDVARVTVQVAVPPADAFDVFANEIDRWWRRGPRFRHAGSRSGIVHLEPRVGGRVFESYEIDGVEQVIEIGLVRNWSPPARLAFSWRNATFAPGEWTEVEVTFVAAGSGTRVTVEHRGWASFPADHPAKHGEAAAVFIRSIGLWWGDQLTALREHARDR